MHLDWRGGAGLPSAVIFDLDGVIVDSLLAHRDSWLRLAAEAGLPLDEAMFWETFGLRNDVLLAASWAPARRPMRCGV
jgi:beta-phosphoglucomutase-like phosphatase (HAD superfamily)